MDCNQRWETHPLQLTTGSQVRVLTVKWQLNLLEQLQ
jgi:hypothetical protein